MTDMMNNTTNTSISSDLDPLLLWRLDPELNNIALGTFWTLITIVTVSVNLFICVYTVVYMSKKSGSLSPSYTSQSSLLLFNLAMSFVIEGIIALPFIVVATTSGEWLIYQSIQAKENTCLISGFVLNAAYSVGLHTLAAISIERFLFVSKPHIHKSRFTNKLIILIIIGIWIYCFLLATTPFIDFGGYTFYTKGGVCIPPINAGNLWLVVYIISSTIPIMILIIMIIATFIFARRFAHQLRSSRRATTITSTNMNGSRSSWQHKSSPNRTTVEIIDYRKDKDAEKENQRKCCCLCGGRKKCFTLYGVFVALVVIYGIQLLTGTVSSIITIPKGTEFQPAPLQATSTFLTVALPAITGIIQVYFRPEFRHALYWLLRCLVCIRRTRTPWDSTVPNYKSQLSKDSKYEKGDSPGQITTVTNDNKVKILDEDNKCNMELEDSPVTVTMKMNSEINVVPVHTKTNAEVVNINRTSDASTSPSERTDTNTVPVEHVYFRGDSQATITGLGDLKDDKIDEDGDIENAN